MKDHTKWIFVSLAFFIGNTHCLDCDFALSFSNNDAATIWKQGLIVGPNDFHLVNREHLWLMHVANDGTILNSLKLISPSASLDLIGIEAFANGQDMWIFGYYGSNDAFLISAA